MTKKLSLSSLLDSENIIRPNFDSQYQKLNIVFGQIDQEVSGQPKQA